MMEYNMEIPELAINKECKNLYYIYLFYIEEKWWAFGYSAYYLSIMYPDLDIFSATSEDYVETIPCICVPKWCLLNISDFYRTLVSDVYIQASAPPTAYSYRKEYEEWCKKKCY